MTGSDPKKVSRCAIRITYTWAADTVTFGAVLDPHHVVREAQERNNEHSVELTCGAPPVR